jgi:hypothetical protein
MERRTTYDPDFYQRVEKLGKFEDELKTLYLRDDVSNDDEDFMYLCSRYKFNVARSLWWKQQ